MHSQYESYKISFTHKLFYVVRFIFMTVVWYVKALSMYDIITCNFIISKVQNKESGISS